LSFDDTHIEIRNAATSATVESFKMDPKATKKAIQDLKPQIKETLEAKFSQLDKSNGSQQKKKTDPQKQTQKNKPPRTPEKSGNIKNSQQTHSEEETQDGCQFCGKEDPSFVDENALDVHLMRDCPMLIECDCGQVVEIASLSPHLLSECESSNQFRECPTCFHAVYEEQFEEHTQDCSPISKNCERCPLCQEDINSARWMNHIGNCTSNPRKIN